MPAAKSSCPKCDAKMQRGYVHMPWPQSGGQSLTWVLGRPAAVPIFGTGGKAKKPHVVTSWRCADCGYLESYAE